MVWVTYFLPVMKIPHESTFRYDSLTPIIRLMVSFQKTVFTGALFVTLEKRRTGEYGQYR
jgi:hypothetical protein